MSRKLGNHPRANAANLRLIGAVALVVCALGPFATVGSAENIVFATSSTHEYSDFREGKNGKSALVLADEICQARAKAAKLNGTFQAWLSNSKENAKDRLRVKGSAWPFHRTDGEAIAKNWKDLLDGELTPTSGGQKRGITFDENETDVGLDAQYDEAWTGTDSNGSVSRDRDGVHTCDDWSSDTAEVAFGRVTGYERGRWTKYDTNSTCTAKRRLYCIGGLKPGSFEGIRDSLEGDWAYVPQGEVPDFNSDSEVFELHNGKRLGVEPPEGSTYFIELNSKGKDTIYTDVEISSANQKLTVTFLHHRRSAAREEKVGVRITRVGETKELHDQTFTAGATGWTEQTSDEVTIDKAGTVRIEIYSVSPTHGEGNLLDDIDITVS